MPRGQHESGQSVVRELSSRLNSIIPVVSAAQVEAAPRDEVRESIPAPRRIGITDRQEPQMVLFRPHSRDEYLKEAMES